MTAADFECSPCQTGNASVEREPDVIGFFAQRNEVKRRAVFRNIAEHRHGRRYSVIVKRLTPADDCTRREIKAALVPAATDDPIFVDATGRPCGTRRARRLVKKRQLQMRAGVVEGEDFTPLL